MREITNLQMALDGIADQCGKGHYWNAIARTQELLWWLTRRFDDVLKGREVGESNDRSVELERKLKEPVDLRTIVEAAARETSEREESDA